MTLGKILTYEDRIGVSMQQHVLATVRAVHGDDVHRQCAPAVLDTRPLPAVAAFAVVNHGRWIVRCHTCSGAQFASRAQRLFWCTHCLNHRFDGKWVLVVWPNDADVERIERLLMARHNPANRNWEAHETLEDLERENREHASEVTA